MELCSIAWVWLPSHGARHNIRILLNFVKIKSSRQVKSLLMFIEIEHYSLNSQAYWIRNSATIPLKLKLEQLERLRSEDTPAAPWLPILLTSSYWIPSQKNMEIIDLQLKMLQSGHDFQSQGRMTLKICQSQTYYMRHTFSCWWSFVPNI